MLFILKIFFVIIYDLFDRIFLQISPGFIFWQYIKPWVGLSAEEYGIISGTFDNIFVVVSEELGYKFLHGSNRIRTKFY